MRQRSSIIFLSFLLIWVLGVTPALVCACDGDSNAQSNSHACCPESKVETSDEAPGLANDCCVCFSEMESPTFSLETGSHHSTIFVATLLNSHANVPVVLALQASPRTVKAFPPGPAPVYLRNQSFLL